MRLRDLAVCLRFQKPSPSSRFARVRYRSALPAEGGRNPLGSLPCRWRHIMRPPWSLKLTSLLICRVPALLVRAPGPESRVPALHDPPPQIAAGRVVHAGPAVGGLAVRAPDGAPVAQQPGAGAAGDCVRAGSRAGGGGCATAARRPGLVRA